MTDYREAAIRATSGRYDDQRAEDTAWLLAELAAARKELDEWATPEARAAWAGLHETVKQQNRELAAAREREQTLREALTKIAAMEPVKPLEHQEFLGGAYLPHGPVNGCARAALAATEEQA